MTDMDALDRLIAEEVVRASAPPRPVDDAAIFTAITTTQSPKWRLQSMFSATKFVVAGAVVALFGGLLLAGVLTQPTAVLAPATSPSLVATQDLLSRLETEEVAPGVFRVLSDGHRDLDAKVGQVAIASEGDAWVTKVSGNGLDVRILRVGEPGVAYRLDESTGAKAFGRLVTGADGAIGYAQWINEVPAVLEGREWVAHDGSRFENCVLLFGSVAADGSCFQNEQRGSGLKQQIRDETRSITPTRVGSFGSDAGARLWEIRLGEPVSSDGIVWVPAYRDDGSSSETSIRFEGLARYDGESWSTIPYPKGSDLLASGPMSVTPDGVVWIASYVDGEGLTMVSWDGELWHSFGPVAVPRAYPDAHLHPNGTTTFGVMASFDGTSLTSLELPDGVVEGMGPLTFAPDGSAWAVGNGGLYVFAPEAVVATEW